jgi:hypothetical protein
LPSRTVGVCWPTGAWPTRDAKTGRWNWWARLADIQDPNRVDFPLVSRQQRLPLCISFGTDPHDSFRRDFNKSYREEMIDGARHIAFGVTGGDLDYMGWENAEANFAFIENFFRPVPFLMVHVLGNHDLPGIGPQGDLAPHELAGQGPFSKHLGPTRWSFDCAGVHFAAFNWPMIDDAGCAWLEKDFQSVPKETPIYLFIHMWDKFLGPIVQKYPNCKLVLAGHSHRNMFCGKEGTAEFWTKMSLYTYLYVHKDRFEFVDRCIYEGARNGWDGHWGHHGRGCALYNPEPAKEDRGRHVGLENVTLDDRSQAIETVPGATYDLRFGAKGTGGKPARRWGLRLTGQDGKTQEFVYDDREHTVTLMGLETPFSPVVTPGHGGQAKDLKPEEQRWVEMRIFVMPDRIRVLVNSRLHYQKHLTPGEARKIEVFAEGGAAEFGRVDVWQRTWKDYKPRETANSG